jgi:ribonuclease VapC
MGFECLQEFIFRLQVEIVPCDSAQAQLAYEAWLRLGKARHPAGLNFGDCFSFRLGQIPQRTDFVQRRGFW